MQINYEKKRSRRSIEPCGTPKNVYEVTETD